MRYGATCEAVAQSITVPRWSIWTKRLVEPKGAMAVLVLNLQNASNLTLSVSYNELAAAAGGKWGQIIAVRDVWNGKLEPGVAVSQAKPWTVADVPPHGNAFVVMEPATNDGVEPGSNIGGQVDTAGKHALASDAPDAAAQHTQPSPRYSVGMVSTRGPVPRAHRLLWFHVVLRRSATSIGISENSLPEPNP